MGSCCDSNNNKKGKPINEVKTDNELIEVDKNLIEVLPSVCKIKIKDLTGSGFFIKLYKNSKEFCCLLTNEHVIKEEFVQSNESAIINYEIEKKYIMIELNPKKRFIKCNKDMDVTIIEIIKSDKIEKKYFLTPNYGNISKNQAICVVQFPEGKLSHSYGIIKDINDFNLTHDAGTTFGSSGSPIFLKDTTYVIGIHKQGNPDEMENYGTLIGPIIELLQKDRKNSINNKKKSNIGQLVNNNNNYNTESMIGQLDNNNNKSNIGKLVNNQGEIYIGPVSNKVPNGKGKLYNKKGEIIYEGYFVNGIEEGEGKRITNNYYYIGKFIKGKMNGEGTIYFKNGNIKYIGDFVNDKKEGIGKLFFEDKECYMIENNKKFYMEKGDYFIGHYKNDKWNGKGALYLKDGRIKYEGNFVNDKFEGHGRYNFESGKYYIGQWHNDMQNGKGKIYEKNGKLLFEGDFIDDMMDGIGKLYLSNGNYYIGKFMKGKIHGKGKLYLKDGSTVFECLFINGKLKSIEEKNKEKYKNDISEILKTNFYSKRYI